MYLSLGKYLLTKVPTEKLRGIQIHFPAKDIGKLVLHSKKGQSWHMSGLEFYQHINIAVRPKVAPQRRAKDGEFPYSISLAERGDPIAWELNMACLSHCEAILFPAGIGFNPSHCPSFTSIVLQAEPDITRSPS